jgi:hypothetical protein
MYLSKSKRNVDFHDVYLGLLKDILPKNQLSLEKDNYLIAG